MGEMSCLGEGGLHSLSALVNSCIKNSGQIFTSFTYTVCDGFIYPELTYHTENSLKGVRT